MYKWYKYLFIILQITKYGEIYTSGTTSPLTTTGNVNGSPRNILDDGSGNMSIAGNLNVHNTLNMTTTSGQVITFTGQGGDAYITDELNLHFPNATSTYTWHINNGSKQLLTLGIGVGNAGDLDIAGGLTIAGNFNIANHMITNFGDVPGSITGIYYATTMTGMVQISDAEFVNSTGQSILVIFQPRGGEATGLPGGSSGFNNLTAPLGSAGATYVYFGILNNGGYIDYKSVTINYFWMAA